MTPCREARLRKIRWRSEGVVGNLAFPTARRARFVACTALAMLGLVAGSTARAGTAPAVVSAPIATAATTTPASGANKVAPPSTLTSADDRLLRLGEHFFGQGEHYRAIGVFEELRLFSTDDRLRRHASLRVAMSYHVGLRVDAAVVAYDNLLTDGGPTPTQDGLVRLLRVRARVLGRERGVGSVPATDLLGELAALAEGPEAAGQPEVRTLARQQQMRVHASEGESAAARRVFDRVVADCRTTPAKACATVGTWGTVVDLPPPARKHPALGAALSLVLPGAGALYNQRFVDAAYYLALTAGSYALASQLWRTGAGWGGQRASFYLVGSLGLTFHLAAIAQGALGARRWNEVERHRHRQRVFALTETPLPLREGLAP